MPAVRITPLPRAIQPLDVALRFARKPGLAWLDGGLDHGRQGRYSFVASGPCEVVESVAGDAGALRLLDALRGPDADAGEPDPLFAAGDIPLWVGHVSYDARAGTRPPQSAFEGTPAVRFARYDGWYAFDHQEQRAYVIAEDERAARCVLKALAAQPLGLKDLGFEAGAVRVAEREEHEAAIREALALIREGELYEINLARCFSASFAGSALGLFLKMREASAVPLGYFVDGSSHAVLGRSMECFLRYQKHERVIWTSPIKGTVARAGDDAGEAARLRSDPKEHAEHAMVVDLMRNDLSRVCEVGSVEVTELMTVLPFAGLSHLVSTVRGRARNELSLHELLANTFPPGSVTGAPKERVMRAIGELEPTRRGLYTGCMGFVDRAGGCSLAVAIRTAVVARGRVDYFAGGGIVADSIPAREVDETELKAQLFVRALGA